MNPVRPILGLLPRRRTRVVAAVSALLCAAGLAVAAPAEAVAAFAARASLLSAPQYINDPAGADLTFTIQNTGSTASIGAVEIDSPGTHEVVGACPSAPEGWTTQVSATICRYLSASGTADDIAPGASSSAFVVHATNVGQVTDYVGTWSVTVSKTDDLDTTTNLTHAFATGDGLRPTAYTWEITDAVVAGAAATPGSACPASNKTAPTGSTGNVIVVCGYDHSARQQTPDVSLSSLDGTLIASHGALTTARIPAQSGNVVIGNWNDVAITSNAGSDKTVIAKIIGHGPHQTSPTTTLSGYVASDTTPTANGDSYSTNEDTALTVAAPGVLGNDTDPNNSALTALVDSGPSHGEVTLNPDGGFTYTPAGDYNGSDSFTYHATNGSSDSNSATVSITVTAVNDAPSFSLPASPDQSVPEDAGAQTVSGFATNVVAGPANESGQALTFHVSNDNNGLFSAQPSIDPATGDLTYTPAPNVNGSTTVSAYLTDSGGTANGGDDTSGTQTFTITVTPVNDAPSFSLPANPNQTVLDDAGAQTVSGFATNISAGPPDESGQALTFHVSNDGNGLFSAQPAIDATTGDLTYTPIAGQTGTATVTVSLSDDGGTVNGGSDTSPNQTFTITVNPSNAAPTDIQLSNSTIAENSGANAVVGTFSSTDPNAGDTHTYTLVTGTGSDDNDSFNITADGVLQANVSFNFEAKSSYTIRVRSTDGGGLFVEKQFTITVTDVNEAPTDITLTTSSITENLPAGTTVGNLLATDPDTGQAHTFTLQMNGCAGGPYLDNASFAISGNTLQSAASFDFETHNSYTICVRTTDAGTPALSYDKLLVITINDADDAPVAVADSYSGVIGNTVAVLGTTASGPSVTLSGSLPLANDTDQDTGAFAHALSAVPQTVASTGGGSATINSDGSFTYTPGVGDKNQDDTFTYHVTDGTLTSAGTVTIGISNFLVWYVDSSSAAASHDGRSSSPFTGLSSLNAANGTGDVDASGDIVFLYRGNSGTTPYTGGIPLEASEALLGQSNGLVVNGHTLVSAGVGNAVITNSAGAGVALASSASVEGISVSGASGAGVLGVGITSAQVDDATTGTISGSAGGGVSLSGAAGGTIAIGATISGNTGHSVQVSGRSSGGVTFSGSVTDASTGVLLSGNTGATVSFSGGVVASTGANSAFAATGGGTVAVTGSANTLTTSTGTALDVENTTIGAGGLAFKAITANGGSHGIVLLNTGTSGGLTVAGTGTANSGGSITGITGSDVATNACASLGAVAPAGVGIYLNNTKAPSFSWMNFPGSFGNFGILGYNVAGFTLDHSTMTGTYGGNVDQDEDTVHFCTLTGAADISNDTISNGAETNLRIVNASGTLDRLTMASDTIGLNQANGGDGTLLEADGGTFKATVTDTTFQGSRGSPFQAVPQAGATMDLVFGSPGHGNTIHNTHSNIVPFAQDLNVAAGGNLTFDINSNHFDSSNAVQAQGGVFINSGASTGVASGYFRNNTIGTSGVANSGSSGNDPALDVESNGGGDLTISITNNQIYQFGANGAGFLAQAGATSGNPTTFNVTATGNTIAQPGTFALSSGAQGFQLDNGTNSGENFTSCLNFASNTVNGSGGGGAGGDVRIRQRFGTKVDMPGYTGAANGGSLFADVVNYIHTKDPVGPPVVTAIGDTSTGGGFFNTPGGAACATPSF